ncbi:MAG TPA: hypothetical protein VHA14_04050, partial [Bryobacteraceae bacterium]|nr:hypothetical protein [Bryobacteraceae bacterium]
AWVLITGNRSVYNLLSWALFAVLMIPFLMKAWGGAETNARMFGALGAIACLGMLPVYHRVYDLLILVLAFPSVICLFVQHHRLRWIAAGATVIALTPAWLVAHAPLWRALNFAWHFEALAVIVLSICCLAAMYSGERGCEAVYGPECVLR